MSTTQTTDQTNVQGKAILSDNLASEGPWRVHGVAIGPDETTVGMSGQKKFWPGDALQEAADTLAGQNIVKNHVNNDVDAVVGAVTDARYHPEYGVIYEGEIDEKGLAQKVARNRLDVSPRIIHNHVDELEENEDGALVVDEVKEFVNLALVPQGAAQSNEIEIGDSGMLSMSRADLRQALDYEVEDEPEEVEAEDDTEAAETASAPEADDVDAEESGTDADDLGADEGLDEEVEAPVSSSEESAQESGEELSCECGDCECADCECADCCDCVEEAGMTDSERVEDAVRRGVEAASEYAEPDAEEMDTVDADFGDGSILSELEVLGADSQDTDDIDLSDIEILH